MARRKVTPRRIKVNSAAGQALAMQAAIEPEIAPPAHVKLLKKEIPFWNSIIEARAKHLWNKCDLEMAAVLARTKAQIFQLQNEICKEGLTPKAEKGKQPNPKFDMLETLIRRAIALSRMLHVHAEATIGVSRESAKARKAQEDAKQAVAENKKASPKKFTSDLIPMRNLN